MVNFPPADSYIFVNNTASLLEGVIGDNMRPTGSVLAWANAFAGIFRRTGSCSVDRTGKRQSLCLKPWTDLGSPGLLPQAHRIRLVAAISTTPNYIS